MLAEASDGAAIFLHWWDTELDVACKFEPMGDAEERWRCLPARARTVYEGIDELFADAQCSGLLARDRDMPSDGPSVVQRVDTRCWIARDYFRPGDPFMGDVVYRDTDQGCTPEAAATAGLGALRRLEPLSLDAFVAATVAGGPSAGRVVPHVLVADDGARATHGLRDLTGDFGCWPRATAATCAVCR